MPQKAVEVIDLKFEIRESEHLSGQKKFWKDIRSILTIT